MLDALVRSNPGRRLLSLERQRRWWLDRVPDGPLKTYYMTPFAQVNRASEKIEFLALDFETSGLAPETDEILSIGYTLVRDHAVHLSECHHVLVRPSGAIPAASAVAHGILDDRARTGVALDVAVPPLLEALAGRVLVAHHAGIEQHFLDRACRRLYHHPFVAPIVDTLELERRALARRNTVPRSGSMRLAALRAHYNLPRYVAHDALIDAIASAELLLAQIAQRSAGGRSVRLGELTSIP